MRDRRQHLEGVAVVCSRERSVWLFGLLFCGCIGVGGVVLCRSVCVCDLLIFLRERRIEPNVE